MRIIFHKRGSIRSSTPRNAEFIRYLKGEDRSLQIRMEPLKKGDPQEDIWIYLDSLEESKLLMSEAHKIHHAFVEKE